MGSYIPNRLKPRETVEVSGEHMKLRLVLVTVLFLIGLAGIGFGLKYALSQDPGWTTIKAGSSYPAEATGDLNFQYCFGENATAESKRITALYSENTYRSYQIFHPTEAFEDLGNLYAVNAAPNQTVTVEPELYQAFALLQASDSRVLYLAPVYEQYNAVYRSLSDDEAASYDPAYSEETAAYVKELMGYLADPEAISLELLGENRVRLKVREDYLQFAEDCGIEAFLDFCWVKNAFVLDNLAAELQKQGFVRGYLVSREGFCRYLDPTETEYTLKLTDLDAGGVQMPASLRIREALSLISLHGYGFTAGTSDDFYEYANGEIRTPYLDPRTGETRASIQDLTLLSRTASCAELALAALPVLTAEQWDESLVLALQEAEIAAVWCEGKTVCHTALPVELVLEDSAYSEQSLP